MPPTHFQKSPCSFDTCPHIPLPHDIFVRIGFPSPYRFSISYPSPPVIVDDDRDMAGAFQGIVIAQVRGVTIVMLRMGSILDGARRIAYRRNAPRAGRREGRTKTHRRFPGRALSHLANAQRTDRPKPHDRNPGRSIDFIGTSPSPSRIVSDYRHRQALYVRSDGKRRPSRFRRRLRIACVREKHVSFTSPFLSARRHCPAAGGRDP